MTLHTDVVAAFAAALVGFPVNHDCSDNTYVQKVFDTISVILCSLEYNTVVGVHNLVGINNPTAYITKYGESFPVLKRPKVFNDDINIK